MARKKAAREEWSPESMCSAMDLDHPMSIEDLAILAVEENPQNAPMFSQVLEGILEPQHVALLTTKWWKADKKVFTFAFMETVRAGVPERISKFANRWKDSPSSLEFRHTNDVNAADFRIAFGNDGYYSYLGVDCRSIPKNRHTMNLQGMNSNTFSEKEGLRVIPHEFFHGVGSPHEHSRPAIVNRLDPAKTIAVFRRDQGWSESMVRSQVLTPLSEASIFGTQPDEESIMAYWFTGECTKDGKPIVGGFDLSASDKAFARATWPGGAIDPPPPGGKYAAVLTLPDGTQRKLVESA